MNMTSYFLTKSPPSLVFGPLLHERAEKVYKCYLQLSCPFDWMSISWIEILCKQFFYFFLQPARSHRDFCCELPSPWKTVRSPKSWPSRNATNTATFPLPFIKICYCINQKAHLMPQVCSNFNGRGSWTRTNACWIQNPVPYQLGDTPINHTLLCREQGVLYDNPSPLSSIFENFSLSSWRYETFGTLTNEFCWFVHSVQTIKWAELDSYLSL